VRVRPRPPEVVDPATVHADTVRFFGPKAR
jgi:hypothetical protein